jgi:hypothetical protein
MYPGGRGFGSRHPALEVAAGVRVEGCEPILGLAAPVGSGWAFYVQ